MNLNSLHRLPATGMVLACVLLGGLLFADAPATAELQYPLVGEISSASTPKGQFLFPNAVALGGARGNVIVDSDSGIDAFGASGEFEWFINESTARLAKNGSGMAVNEGTGDIYVAGETGYHEGAVDVFGSTGGYLFEINAAGAGKPVPNGIVDPGAVGVDQKTGDVYVYDRGNQAGGISEAIDVFTANGEYLFQITSAGPNSLGRFVHGLAVDDSTGALLVGGEAGKGEGSVYVFDAATGAYITTWSGANTPQKMFSGGLQIAVNNTTGEVYVAADGLSEGFGQNSNRPAVVDRFSATGEYESQITGVFGEPLPPTSVDGVALSPTSGDVYVLQSCENAKLCPRPNRGLVYVFGTPVAVPRVSLTPLSNLKPTSMTLHGLVNPEGTGEASCEFELGTSTSYGQRVSCGANIANGNAAVAVQAQFSGLKSDTTYYYRLDAKDLADGQTNLGEGGEDLGSVTTPGPKLVAEGPAAVTAESASFEATVIPNGVPTSAYFEYGTSEAYGATAPAPPGVVLGAGTSEVEFSRHVQGLQAGTVYHYRLVVLSELQPGRVEEVDGPDRTLTTQLAAGSFALPDGRAWELVTPAEKHGALFFGQNYGNLIGLYTNPLVAEASVNGDAMIDLASVPTESDPPGYGIESSVFSARGPEGWSSHVLGSPNERAAGISYGRGGEYQFFSEDLSRAVVDPLGTFEALAPEATESTPYLHSDYLGNNVNEPCESSCYRPLVTAANTQSGVRFGEEPEPGSYCKAICGPLTMATTPDLSHMALSTYVRLTSVPNEGQYRSGPFYYEWGGGELQPLYLLPESEGGGGVFSGPPSTVTHQFADNGSVFFSYKEHLYLHDFAKDESVRLDVARGVSEPAAGGAKFLYAASDGSRVLFSDSKPLTSAGRGGIYECRIGEAEGLPTCELSLTSLSGGTLIGGSKDASYLYFEDTSEHLVVDHYNGGGEWAITDGPYIGQLPFTYNAIPGFEFGVAVSEVSPDGGWLTFMSEEELTGYDNHDARNEQPDVEVFLYEAAANKLVCASCDPTGARPVGSEDRQAKLVGTSVSEFKGATESGEHIPRWVAASLPPWTRANYFENRYQPRFLSDSGRLFFNSRDALSPQDVNGNEDVYEYEPPGVGDCATSTADFSQRSDGCVGLVSSGASSEESAFMDASLGGGDVFFITAAKLTSEDFDNALDVYDAHECTARVPCPAPVAQLPPPCSTGDGCKAAPTPQPSIFGAPSSATFSGAGNVSPPRPGSNSTKSKPKSLSRSRKLALALKACSKKHGAQRAQCVRSAHKRYGNVVVPRKASGSGVSVSPGVNNGKLG